LEFVFVKSQLLILISHRLSIAPADPSMSTSLRSLGLLDVHVGTALQSRPAYVSRSQSDESGDVVSKPVIERAFSPLLPIAITSWGKAP
jgi:hypothetical protein